MSNDNEIYPLDEYKGTYAETDQRSVNQRLAPIYQALAGDPDGWEKERYVDDDGGRWQLTVNFPMTHKGCDHFRLVRKSKKTLTETVSEEGPYSIEWRGGESVTLRFSHSDKTHNFIAALRKAMGEK